MTKHTYIQANKKAQSKIQNFSMRRFTHLKIQIFICSRILQNEIQDKKYTKKNTIKKDDDGMWLKNKRSVTKIWLKSTKIGIGKPNFYLIKRLAHFFFNVLSKFFPVVPLKPKLKGFRSLSTKRLKTKIFSKSLGNKLKTSSLVSRRR